jgi:hypothetical protein
MKNITQPLKVIALALTLSIGISYVSAWTAPTATPPGGNVAAPINVSSSSQIKTGDLSVWSLIGNSVTTNSLRVASGAAAGRVLTSDASGNASWQVASGGTAYSAGNGLTLTGSTFSTNTTQTQARVSGTCAVGSSIRTISSTGTVTCDTGSGGIGDNLGNHTATQALNMANQAILGGTGNLVSVGAGNDFRVATGRIGSASVSPTEFPPGWGGGVSTWDVTAKGGVRTSVLCFGDQNSTNVKSCISSAPSLKQDSCYYLGYGIPEVRCAVGYYVAGSFDDGGGYPGDNGMICCHAGWSSW